MRLTGDGNDNGLTGGSAGDTIVGGGGSQSTAMIPAAPGGIESGEKQSKTARS